MPDLLHQLVLASWSENDVPQRPSKRKNARRGGAVASGDVPYKRQTNADCPLATTIFASVQVGLPVPLDEVAAGFFAASPGTAEVLERLESALPDAEDDFALLFPISIYGGG
jgi:hypothetical protein